MSYTETMGYYNYQTQTIYPNSNSTWSGLSGTTWDTWNEWAYSTEDQIIWLLDPLDVGAVKNFTLDITCVANGSVSYQIWTNNTGYWTDAYTETVIAHGAVNQPSFTGQYALICVIVDKTVTTPTISEITVNYADAAYTEFVINDLDTSTLSGSSTARQLPLTTKVSKIVDIKITPHETTSPYNLDVYVTNTATSTYLIPKIISKSSTAPTIALVGVDNHPRDGIVDVIIKAMPEQYMSGNNLRYR